MTCIAAIIDDAGSVWMGGDSAACGDHLSIATRQDPKVFRVGCYLIGFVESFRMGQILQYHLNPDVPPKRGDLKAFMAREFVPTVRKVLKDHGFARVENTQETFGDFLVGVRGRIFSIHEDLDVGEYHRPFAAIGCGSDLALGSLFTSTRDKSPRRRLQTALQAAATFSAGVRGPFTILHSEE